MRGLLIKFFKHSFIRQSVFGSGILVIYLLISLDLNSNDGQPNNCALRNRIESSDCRPDSAIFMVFAEDNKFFKKSIDHHVSKNTVERAIPKCVDFPCDHPQRYAVKIFILVRSLLI